MIMIMKTRLLILFLMAAAAVSTVSARAVPKEKITYDVMYKWGLINKKAGSVALVTYPEARTTKFRAMLTAATAPWADKFYLVRDTLKGHIDAETFTPFYYEKISHEGGDYNRDLLYFTKTGNTMIANATRWRLHKKDKEVKKTEVVHEATGLSMDMLTSYYYMRQIDYSSMKPGQDVKLNILSGSKKEYLTIHYKGVEMVEVKGKRYPAFHITFKFTTDGGKISSDNMDAWISTSGSHIPLLLEGKLPVGKVRAVYSGKMS